jgi:hypothetical protein
MTAIGEIIALTELISDMPAAGAYLAERFDFVHGLDQLLVSDSFTYTPHLLDEAPRKSDARIKFLLARFGVDGCSLVSHEACNPSGACSQGRGDRVPFQSIDLQRHGLVTPLHPLML